MKTIVHTRSLTDYRTHLWALTFVAGNVLLPQLFHLWGAGGPVFLPILFFTLIAAATMGRSVALVTGVLSPLISAALTGMPSGAILIILMVKSVALALVAGSYFEKQGMLRPLPLVGAILISQAAGFFASLAFHFPAQVAWQSMLISWPGMALQCIAGSALWYWFSTRKL